MDNSRELDMEKIMSDVKEQYEEISSRSRKEAEVWYQTKVKKIKNTHKSLQYIIL